MQRHFESSQSFRRGTFWSGVVGSTFACVLTLTALLSALLEAECVAQAAVGLVGERCVSSVNGATPHHARGTNPHTCCHCTACSGAAVGPAILPVVPRAAVIMLFGASVCRGTDEFDLVHCLPGALPRGPPQAIAEP